MSGPGDETGLAAGATRAIRCSNCGERFDCGRDANHCWCTELAALDRDALDPASDCLCPRCLRERLQIPPDNG